MSHKQGLSPYLFFSHPYLFCFLILGMKNAQESGSYSTSISIFDTRSRKATPPLILPGANETGRRQRDFRFRVSCVGELDSELDCVLVMNSDSVTCVTEIVRVIQAQTSKVYDLSFRLGPNV